MESDIRTRLSGMYCRLGSATVFTARILCVINAAALTTRIISTTDLRFYSFSKSFLYSDLLRICARCSGPKLIAEIRLDFRMASSTRMHLSVCEERDIEVADDTSEGFELSLSHQSSLGPLFPFCFPCSSLPCGGIAA